MTTMIESIGGNCPVQAEGTIDGKPFYFRARGEHWSMSIGGADVVGAPEWYHHEEWGAGPYDAGWMPIDAARQMIDRAAALYLAGTAGTLGLEAEESRIVDLVASSVGIGQP